MNPGRSYPRPALFDEGVIKFRAEHESAALPAYRYGELACKLVAWREIMAKTQLVGQDPARYGGAGFGNVSARVGAPTFARGKRGFLITGTQTGGKASIGLGDFCVVDAYDYRANRVRSSGPVLPSSEAMTHGAIYDLTPHIRVVLHAHSPVIWERAQAMRLPTTDPNVAYGTPEMAVEVQRLYRSTALPELRVLAMGGHEDGIIAFGHTCADAGHALISQLARAYELVCQRG